jgi:hypothetical protein
MSLMIQNLMNMMLAI